jgi:hypothetical protein
MQSKSFVVPEGMVPIPGLRNHFINKQGQIWSLNSGTYRKVARQVWRSGCVRRTITIGRNTYSLARLLLLTFVGPPPYPRADSCHWNDDGDDNRLSNLYWGTRGQNVRDAMRNGKWPSPRGRKFGSKYCFTIDELNDIKTNCGSPTALARKYGCSRTVIFKVLNNEHWSQRDAV